MIIVTIGASDSVTVIFDSRVCHDLARCLDCKLNSVIEPQYLVTVQTTHPKSMQEFVVTGISTNWLVNEDKP